MDAFIRRVLIRPAGTLAKLILFVALPATFIIGAVRFAFSWQPVYTYAVETYQADEVTGVPMPQLLQATHTIRNYFTNSQSDLDISVVDATGAREPLFNKQEIAHMRDVKRLVQRFYLLLDPAAVYVAAYVALSLTVLRRSARSVAWDVLQTSMATIVILVAFGVAALLDFDQLFIEFHVLSFSNDFWQLDPTRDHLVQMFPQGFWLDVTVFVALIALTGAVLLGLLSGGVLLWKMVMIREASPDEVHHDGSTSPRNVS